MENGTLHLCRSAAVFCPLYSRVTLSLSLGANRFPNNQMQPDSIKIQIRGADDDDVDL
jgi:hypothetical protein